MEKKKVMKCLNNLIVFEGIDGCGKTTQVEKFANRLRDEFGKKNYTICKEAEPTKSGVGRFLRDFVLSGKCPLTTKVIARLFAADREAHLDDIRTREKSKCFTVCDRYIASNVAYQGQDDLHMREFILEQNRNFERPFITFYLKVNEKDVPKVFERVCKRGETKEIFDQVDTQKKLSKIFDDLLIHDQQNYTDWLCVVDASKSEDEIADKIWNEFCRVLEEDTIGEVLRILGTRAKKESIIQNYLEEN